MLRISAALEALQATLVQHTSQQPPQVQPTSSVQMETSPMTAQYAPTAALQITPYRGPTQYVEQTAP